MSSTIKSRPAYDGLRPTLTARRNLVAVEGEGAQAVLRMMAQVDEDFAARTHLLYVDTGIADRNLLDRLRDLGTDGLNVLASAEEALDLLDTLLTRATMGTRLYAAGTEGFIGRVVRLAVDHGIDHKSVLTEHSGSLARRVQCVHCKHTAEHVTATIYECPGCGVVLFVRDHYSRRLAAFQGVCVNAEDPSERPLPEEAYP